MILRKDNNKPLLELNNDELKIYYLFRTISIPLNNILSSYVYNDVIYVLTKDGKKYTKPLWNAKFSERNNIELITEKINNENLLFYTEEWWFMANIGLILLINISKSVITEVILFLLLIIFGILALFHINIIKTSSICYNTKNREFIKYNKRSEILLKDSISSIRKIKRSSFNGNITIKSEKLRIILPPEVSYPKRYNIAINEMLLFSNNNVKK